MSGIDHRRLLGNQGEAVRVTERHLMASLKATTTVFLTCDTAGFVASLSRTRRVKTFHREPLGLS